ncbi:hypothetical protein AGR1A_Lc80381 [Agrobacterium fabacearum CFBP 5771]|nr:hypothetical protein AGR1B_Lc10725 [Agrobacterium fabacearum S56]CUX00720.1 hypothetical protein AGR1C_Lc30071 [Agrobacterium fabacearum TT111]CVI22936.1 hypothetical protein AGR1A_Lc80381 [Agrobacterium fabacearum CFBP 5771]
MTYNFTAFRRPVSCVLSPGLSAELS